MSGTSLSGSSQAFDVAYPDHPWAGLDRNQRQWYDPILRDIFRKKNVYGQFTTYTQNNGAVNAKTMTISGLYDLHENVDPLGLRQMWLPAAHVDSWQVDVTFSTYGNKVAYDAYDKIITYWKTTGNMNADTLAAISNDKLGINIAGTLDLLSRNALLNLPYNLFGSLGTYTQVDDIPSDDKLQTSTINEIHLGMANRDVPYASSPTGGMGTIVAITSPGVAADIQSQSDPKDWLYPMAYADPSRLLNNEVGTYRNVRFITTPKAQLLNGGAVQYQTTVVSPIAAGDGAPSTLVDSTIRSGQAGATHYIQLKSDADMTQFNVNDIVAVHVLRGDGTNPRIALNSVDYTDGTLHNLRIVDVNTGSKRLSFAQPIMSPFTTDLGSTTYAYVTVATHIHATVFIGGPDAIVAGVGRPLTLHYPPPVDDRESIYRVSWDIYSGWQTYNPNVAEVVFTAGSVRVVGQALQ